MDNKKALLGVLGGITLISACSGAQGLKKGLEAGSKIGFAAGVSTGVIGSAICVVTKNMIKKKRASCK